MTNMTAEFYFNSGVKKVKQKDYDGAIADFTKAIEMKPDSAELYFSRGLAKNNKKDYDGAIADFTKAIELDPNDAEFYYYLGITKNAKQDYNGAIADFTKAIELKPDDAKAYYYNRGLAKSEKQDYDGAIADFDKAIELKPDDAKAYYNRDVARLNKGNHDGDISDLNTDKELKQDFKDKDDNTKISPNTVSTEKITAQKKQAEFQLSKQEYDKLIKEVNALKLDIVDISNKVKGFLTGITAQGLSNIYKQQSKWQFWTYVVLRGLEILIYILIICFLYLTGLPLLENILKDNTTDMSKLFILIIKIGITIPIYFLVRLINSTANRFSQRAELDADTATQWSFFEKMEIDLKNLKDNPIYAELYRNFLEQNIALRHKTNFELIEEIFAKRHEKSLPLKQIDALADTVKKIKDIYVTPEEKK